MEHNIGETAWNNLRAELDEICSHMDKTKLECGNEITESVFNQELIWVLEKLDSSDAFKAINKH